jgi:hypothetical protein
MTLIVSGLLRPCQSGCYRTGLVRSVFAILVCSLAACGACEKGGAAVSGSHPYVRCMAVDAPEPREGTAGRMRFGIDERVLTLTPVRPSATARIFAFRGAGADIANLDRALVGVKEQTPDLVLVLGELGDTDEHVLAHLSAFERIGAPVVVLASGADVAEALHDAWDDAEVTRVFDGRALRAVVIGEEVFVLVSGAPNGRYAATDAHCGFDEDDVEAIEGDVPDGRRWLVSWAAPSGGGEHAVGRGFGGRDAGSTEVAAIARSLGAKGGVFGFPTTRGLMPSNAEGNAPIAPNEASDGLRITVARVAGASDTLFDGARLVPASALLELGDRGLAYVGTTVSTGR